MPAAATGSGTAMKYEVTSSEVTSSKSVLHLVRHKGGAQLHVGKAPPTAKGKERASRQVRVDNGSTVYVTGKSHEGAMGKWYVPVTCFHHDADATAAPMLELDAPACIGWMNERFVLVVRTNADPTEVPRCVVHTPKVVLEERFFSPFTHRQLARGIISGKFASGSPEHDLYHRHFAAIPISESFAAELAELRVHRLLARKVATGKLEEGTADHQLYQENFAGRASAANHLSEFVPGRASAADASVPPPDGHSAAAATPEDPAEAAARARKEKMAKMRAVRAQRKNDEQQQINDALSWIDTRLSFSGNERRASRSFVDPVTKRPSVPIADMAPALGLGSSPFGGGGSLGFNLRSNSLTGRKVTARRPSCDTPLAHQPTVSEQPGVPATTAAAAEKQARMDKLAKMKAKRAQRKADEQAELNGALEWIDTRLSFSGRVRTSLC